MDSFIILLFALGFGVAIYKVFLTKPPFNLPWKLPTKLPKLRMPC